MKNVIDKFIGDYAFLSNFEPCYIYYEDFIFYSVENAYQASKCKNKEDIVRFLGIPPGKAKRLGRTVSLRDDWEDVKVSLMKGFLRQKFFDPKLRNKLLATEGYELIEGNWWNDTFWGVCNGKGENQLGKLLMQIREDIQEGRKYE